jgi:hypothetical protein
MQWDKIMEAAKRLENLLRRADVDFNEAQKAIGYYLFKGCDDTAMERYLKEMAENPPPRSKRTQGYYRELYRIWQQWSPQCGLRWGRWTRRVHGVGGLGWQGADRHG